MTTATADSATPSRTTTLLLTQFELRYGNSLRAGVLGPALIGDLVRGLAFELVAQQDEATDLRGVFAKAEQAAMAAERALKTNGSVPLRHPSPRKTFT